MKRTPLTTIIKAALLCFIALTTSIPESLAAVGNDSCNSHTQEEACTDNNRADAVNIADNACNGKSACTGNEDTLNINFGACIGDTACSFNEVPLELVGIYSCLGEFACSYHRDAGQKGGSQFSVQADSCRNGSCRNGTGSALFGSNTCAAKESCSYWTVQDTFEVATDACAPPVEGAQPGDAEFSCSHLIGTSIRIEQAACLGYQACQSIYTASRIEIGKGSCLATSSCNSISPRGEYVFGEENTGGPVIIGERSCVAESSCKSIRTNSGTIRIGKNSCNGRGACTSIVAESSFVIGDNACNEDYSCQGCLYSVPDGAQECPATPSRSAAIAMATTSSSDYVASCTVILAVSLILFHL